MNAEWKALGGEVRNRLRQTLDPPRFLYFVFVVVGIGGLGAWRALPDMAALRANLSTYAIGISAAAAVELVLGDLTTRASPRARSGPLLLSTDDPPSEQDLSA